LFRISRPKKLLNPIHLTMKKGKTLTALVLVAEIASIAVLHAVKINSTEKTANKEVSRNLTSEPLDARPRSSYSLAAFR
ncbi:MAG TPA: hypothetical protein VI233_07960, partial [Puia sp.]